MLARAVAANEFLWWVERVTPTDACRKLQTITGQPIGRARALLAIRSNSLWFGKIRRPNPAEPKLLNAREWERLVGVVTRLSGVIRGVGIEAAVAIVSTIVRTNADQLRGLRTELHHWEKDELLTDGKPITWPPEPSAEILESAGLE